MSLPNPVSPAASADQDRWFKAEVQPHGGQLKGYLQRNYPGVRDVEDVVQESYLRIWKTRGERPVQCAKAFLFTIARNLAINLLRRDKINPVDRNRDLADTIVLDDRPGVLDVLTERERLELLSDALVALPEKTRAVFIPHKFSGQTQTDVARRLGLTVKTVEYHILKGTRLIEAYFQQRGF